MRETVAAKGEEGEVARKKLGGGHFRRERRGEGEKKKILLRERESLFFGL